MWSNLVAIPPQVVGDVIIPMLELKDIVHLDSAVVRRRKRAALQAMLKFSAKPMSVDAIPEWDVSALKWLLTRKIRIKDISFSTDHERVISLLQDSFSLVHSGVRLECSSPEVLFESKLNILRSFLVKLDALCISRELDLATLSVLAESVCKLRSLEVKRNRNFYLTTERADLAASELIQQMFVKNCGTLETLRVVFYTASFRLIIPPGQIMSSLRDLTIGANDADNAALEALAEGCHWLQKFSFYAEQRRVNAPLDSGFVALIRSNPLLEVVVVTKLPSGVLTEVSIREVAMNCPLLRVLCTPCVRVFLYTVQAFATLCPALTTVQLLWDFHAHIPVPVPVAAHYNAEGAVDAGTEAEAPVDPIDSVIRSLFERVEELTLTSRWMQSGPGLTAVLRCCRQLRVLVDEDRAHLGDEAMRALSTACTELRVVRNLSFLPSAVPHFGAMLAHNPHLVELVLDQLGDDEMLGLIGWHCKELERLTFSSRSARFTDDGLIALAFGCSQLRSLTIESQCAITDQGLRALAEDCHPRLTSLSLPRCELVTEAGALHVLQNCRKLRSLNISSQHVSCALERQAKEKFPRLKLTITRELRRFDDLRVMSMHPSRIAQWQRQQQLAGALETRLPVLQGIISGRDRERGRRGSTRNRNSSTCVVQ